MNLLTIGASLGIVQAVFERGWLSNLFGAEPGPIDAFIPVRVFAVPFGLSMDYEVFLVSRIHEEWGARRDPAAAIREGFARTARVITAAAAIMVCVFGAFAISGQRALSRCSGSASPAPSSSTRSWSGCSSSRPSSSSSAARPGRSRDRSSGAFPASPSRIGGCRNRHRRAARDRRGAPRVTAAACGDCGTTAAKRAVGRRRRTAG